MSYSPIKSIKVFNFMVYSQATINFDDTNIINIKGYNSSGKSAMLKSIVVCLLNKYPKSQTKLIRHGEKYFRIVVQFEDGVSILKDKYITGQSLYEVYKDDKCIYTSKEGNRLTKVDVLPQIIQDYLGLCLVSTGCLNYQSRRDPLWLIETTGSENYNSLNEILKTEEISRAHAMLNSDKNKLNSEIVGIEASLQETKLSLLEIKGYSEELLSKLEDREVFCKSLSKRYRDVSQIMGVLKEIFKLEDIPKICKIKDSQLVSILSIQNILNDIENVKEYPSIEKCNIERYQDISKVALLSNELNSLKDEINPKIEPMNTKGMSGILSIFNLLKDIEEVTSNISTLDSEKESVSVKLSSLVEEANKQGIKFVKCDNCGTYIEVKSGVE